MQDEKKENPAAKQGSDKEIVAQDNQGVQQTDFDIDGYIEKRKEFITKVNVIMVEGKDFHVIQGKKSLAKGGAEKIAVIFNWQAEFKKDTDVIEAFADLKGLVAFVCNLSRDGKFIGQGRGAAILAKNTGDPNKTIKMAQKSGFIDAVLRASGLSDFFTQDLEDMVQNTVQRQNVRPRADYEATELPTVQIEDVKGAKAPKPLTGTPGTSLLEKYLYVISNAPDKAKMQLILKDLNIDKIKMTAGEKKSLQVAFDNKFKELGNAKNS